jgi:Tfp pilus assembly protein PilX
MRMMDGTHQLLDLARSHPVATSRRQAGAATLAVAVIMLLVVSVLVFHSHTAGWLEQRATTNQTRAKQAHAAAEAGLEAALAVLNADAGNPNRTTHLVAANSVAPQPLCTAAAEPAGKFCVFNNIVTGSPGTSLAYSVTLGLVGTDAAATKRFQLTSNGGSDCNDVANINSCSGRATVRQVVEIEPLFPYQSGSPPPAIRSNIAFSAVFTVPQADMRALTTAVMGGAGLGAASAGLVWHEGDLNLNTPQVGSAASPVLLIVAGDLNISAGATVYGFVFVTGEVNCVGCTSPSIYGAIAAQPININLTSDKVRLLPEEATNGPLARVGSTAIRFAKVIGTWRDW